MKYIVLALMALLLTTVALAEESSNEICEYIMVEQGIKTGYFLPSFLPYANEVFTIYSNDMAVGHVFVEDKEITSIGCEGMENSTYSVYVKDLQTIKDVFESNNTIDTFNAKISSKDINVDGASFTKDVKLFFSKIGLRVASWFN